MLNREEEESAQTAPEHSACLQLLQVRGGNLGGENVAQNLVLVVFNSTVNASITVTGYSYIEFIA